MPKVIARIVIDTEDWETPSPSLEQHPVLLWRRIETAHASPFTAHELAHTAGLIEDQYFV